MSENSKIEWTDHTFNPWSGCTKVSPGCLHCYAETLDKRHLREKVDHWGKGAPRLPSTEKNWRQPLKWNARPWICDDCGTALAERLEIHECGTLGRKYSAFTRRARVFCASLADWLDDEVPIEWLARLLATIHAAPNLDWLLLTKRPGNWEARIEAAFECYSGGALCGADGDRDWMLPWLDAWLAGKKPSNVWIGATVEDQVRADERIPQLLAIPAKVRFLSCEPLLGKLDFTRWLHLQTNSRQDRIPGTNEYGPWYFTGYSKPPVSDWPEAEPVVGIHWVICGGESGPGARPMHPQWARDLRDQCAAAGVLFFFKQWGEWSPRCLLTIDGKSYGGGTDFAALDPSCEKWPEVIRLGEHGKNTRISENCTSDMGEETFVQRVGKKLAGRLLDGITHHAFPG